MYPLMSGIHSAGDFSDWILKHLPATDLQHKFQIFKLVKKVGEGEGEVAILAPSAGVTEVAKS